MMALTILSLFIVQAALTSGCNDFLTKEHRHLLTHVTNIIEKNFRPGTSIHVHLPSSVNNTTWRRRSMNPCQHQSSGLDVANALLKALNKWHSWRISVSHGDTESLPEYKVQKQQAYVIFFTSGQVLDDPIFSTIDTLYSQPAWNSKADFLVVVTDHFKDSSKERAEYILEEMWQSFKVLKAVCVIHVLNTSLSLEDTESVHVIDTYTWKPKQSEKMCMEFTEVILLDRWYWEADENVHNHINLYTNELPSDFRGCPLKVATALRNYEWVTDDKNKSTLKYFETEMKFLEYVFKKLNFAMVLDSPQPIISDYALSITNVLKDLAMSDVNLAIGEIPLTYIIAEMFDYTVSHNSYHAVWFVPCGRHESRVTTISRLFSVSIWVVIVIVFFIASILMASMGAYYRRNNISESNIFTKVATCIFTLWAVTLGVSSPELPRTPEVRFFFILFVWYSLAINTVFQTYFTSFLVQPGIKDSIADFEELMKSGIEFGYDPFFNDLIDDSYFKYQEKKRWKECTDRFYCLERVAFTGDFAYFDVNFLKSLYSISNKSNLVCSLDDGKINIVLTMYMKKGDVLIDKINPVVTSIIESGLYKNIVRSFYFESQVKGVRSAWLKRTANETLVPPFDEALIQKDYTSLTLTHLYIAFCFSAIGYASSLLFLLAEILAYRIQLLVRKYI